MNDTNDTPTEEQLAVKHAEQLAEELRALREQLASDDLIFPDEDPDKVRALVLGATGAGLLARAREVLTMAEAEMNEAARIVTEYRERLEGFTLRDHLLVDALDRTGDLAGLEIPGTQARITGSLAGVLVIAADDDALHNVEALMGAIGQPPIAQKLEASGFDRVLVMSTGIRALRIATEGEEVRRAH